MPGSGPAAYGMYSRNAALPDVVHALNRAGFGNENICMVLSPGHPVAAVVRDARIDAGNAEREQGAVSARTIGWFSEFGAVVIPTVGFFIRSLDFFHALVTEQNSSALTRESRALAGLGFSEPEAKRLGRDLSDFGALVYVTCQERDKANSAIELLRGTGASEAASLASTKTAGAAA